MRRKRDGRRGKGMKYRERKSGMRREEK